MYTKIQLLCCSILFAASAFAQIFTYTPQKPKAGDKVLFTYDLSKTKMKNDAKEQLDIGVMWINVAKEKYPIIIPDYGFKGAVISGSFVVPEAAHLLALRIVGENNAQENNGGDGFLIPVHDATGNPVSGAQLARARIVTAGAGEAMLGIQADDEKKMALIESVWKNESIGRVSLLSSYLALTTKMKKNEAEPAVMKILAEAEATKDLTIQDYTVIAFHYNRLKKADKAAAINQLMKDRFPEEMKKRNEYTTLAAISDFDKRFEAIQAFVQKYPVGNEADRSMYNRLYEGLINQYANNKQNVSISKIEQYAAGMDGVEKYRIYNDLAWQWAHNKDTMYAQAEVLSAKATAWARKESQNPKYDGQNYTSIKMLKGQGRYRLGMYADTYAEVQRKLNNPIGAYYAAEEACKANSWAEAEYNDRYIAAAEKVLSRETFLQKAQALAESGSLGKEGKAALERVMLKDVGDVNKMKEYMARVNDKAFEKVKAEYAKNLIDETAPDFTLKNMEGKTVNLKDLKGKTVVIDFWATWCGPCKVSFPGMQQTINKYKDRDDVVFLFVDTWERQPTLEQRKKEVTAFIEQNKYTFNVLYDEQNAQQEYDVVSRYKVDGIPTKFVINKNGRIRFKSVGGNANADKIVSEMTAMIELAEGGK